MIPRTTMREQNSNPGVVAAHVYNLSGGEGGGQDRWGGVMMDPGANLGLFSLKLLARCPTTAMNKATQWLRGVGVD